MAFEATQKYFNQTAIRLTYFDHLNALSTNDVYSQESAIEFDDINYTIIQNLVVNVPCNVYGICKSIGQCKKRDSLSFELWDADYSNNVLIKCKSEVF